MGESKIELAERSDEQLRRWRTKAADYRERAQVATDPSFIRAYIDIADGYSRLILHEETRRALPDLPDGHRYDENS